VANFSYAAKDPAGKTIQGTIKAADHGEAVNQLRSQDLIVLKVEQSSGGVKKAAKGKSGGSESIFKKSLFKVKPSAKHQELVIFTRQLSTMISAGISLLEAIEVLTDQAESPGMKATCERISSELRGGSDLSDAMATCPKAFSRLYVSMVTAGEASGQMDVILERLAEYTEASAELKREIRAAMTYPVISLVLVVSITAFLMIGVVPGFKDVFDGLDAELPGLTLTVLAISDWLRAQWYILILGMAAATVGLVLTKKSEKGALLWDHMTLRVPVFGSLSRKVALARFSRTFATLVQSGVPIMGTLDIVADTAGNRVVANAVRASRESVRNGNMLSEPLSEA